MSSTPKIPQNWEDYLGTISIVEQLGSSSVLYFDTEIGQVVIECVGDTKVKIGSKIGLTFDAIQIHAFSADGKVLGRNSAA